MDALEKLEEMQKQDFIELFEIMDGKHVTIRLLDPPLHEFLPNYEELFEKKCRGEMSADEEKIFERVKKLRENNPMLGHRGIRLAVTYPEIYEMQAVAIIKAAIEVKKRGKNPVPCIEFPMVSEINELKTVKEKIEKRIKEILEEEKVDINYTMGAMIELPRACFIADEIAREVEFISFGTNDLTQATFGYSRDDAEGKFLRYYVDKKILLTDPFQVLDRKGVGELMKIAIKKAKKANERVDIAICGEHGGEENSIKYCHTIGVDITSCSPYRIPIARLAAAQATIDEQ